MAMSSTGSSTRENLSQTYTRENPASDGSYQKNDGTVWVGEKQVSSGTNNTAEGYIAGGDIVIEPVEIDYDELLQNQLKSIRGIAEVNQEIMPGFVTQAQELAKSFAESMNPQIAKEMYSYLGNLNPNWKEDAIGVQRDAMYQVQDFAKQLMSGDIPQDVIDQTMSNMAELGYSKGQFGGMAGSNVARNLGLTSLQLKGQGAQLMTEAVSPLSARLLSTTQSLMPQLVNRGLAAANFLGYTAGGSMGSSQTSQGGVISAAATNADLAWASRMTSYNASMDALAMQYNEGQQKRAERYQAIGTAAGYINGVGRV